MLAVRIDDDMTKRLGALAQRTHRSKSYLVRQAVEQFLEDQEDLLTALSILE
jgi:RHH-type rel operon transcriptional repressor/antitoxin RelB